MAMVEPCSIEWFVTYMRLRNRGCIPTVTPSDVMPGRRALAQFWGPRSALGFVFNDHGVPAYEVYVKLLFSRCLQLPWPMSSVLPFHFARGLMVEALGVEVNWAEFGFRSTHPHQSHSGIPRTLPEFAALSTPLLPLPLVMPHADIGRHSPMAVRIAEHLNAHGTGTAYTTAITPTVEPTPPLTVNPHDESKIVQASILPSKDAQITTTLITNQKLNVGFAVKSENPLEDQSAPVHVQTSPGYDGFKAGGGVTLDPTAMSAVLVLRPTFEGTIENERMRLHKARLDIVTPGIKIRQCLEKERERLTLLQKKVSNKSRSHDKAVAEFRRARNQLKAAKVDLAAQTTKEGLPMAEASVKMFEELVDSWGQYVAFAHSQLESWELKLERQRKQVAKTKDELAASEINSKEEAQMLEKSLASLQALSTVLRSL